MNSPNLTLEELKRYPWTWLGPVEIRDPEGDHFEVGIAELPSFFVAGSSAAEALAEREDALDAYLASFLDRGSFPPLVLSWIVIAHASGVQAVSEPGRGATEIRLTRVAG